MKIQNSNLPNIYQQRTQNQNSFSGLGSGAVSLLRFLDTNQAWGATGVDFTCMVMPRTITDFSRGPLAGIETFRREASGTVNHAAVGLVYGPLAGMLLAAAINSKYDIKANKIFAGSDTIDMLGKIQHEVTKSNPNGNVDVYASRISQIITSPDGKMLSENAQKDFAQTLVKEIKNPSKDNRAMLKNIVLSDFGREDIILKSGEKSIKARLNDVVANISSVSKNFFNKNVIKSFNVESFEDVKFVKSLKQLGLSRSLLGLGIASVIGCCIQPFNIYLTKKKTGSDGFVGVEGREKDKTNKFKALKALAAAAFGTMSYGLICKFKAKDFLPNIQYKGITPTLNQFKLVYGLTIMSRLLAARDKDELREATVKDTLGYLSWLVFGNFVAKGTLKLLDKSLVGRSRDEILYEALHKAGISTVKDGKALSFNKLLKLLPKSDKLTRVKLRNFNISQLAGYLFSGLVLGVGIPKLNIHMTKKSDEKRKARLAAQKMPGNSNLMLAQPNIEFLRKQMPKYFVR